MLTTCLNVHLYPLKETVFSCCKVGLGQSTQTRDIKWVFGKRGVNILSNAKKSPGPGGELSQLPELQNAFALLCVFWVQYKDTQITDSLWHNRTSGLLSSDFTLHHYSYDP